MPEVAVVGAGPAGSLAAKMLAASGRDVTVIEEHHEAGLPMHCAGILTADTIRLSGVRPDILGTICSADVIFPDGRRLALDRRTPLAYAVDRRVLDSRMADAAAEYGVDFRYGERFRSVTTDGKGVHALTDTGEIRADLLIGADGQCSLVSAGLGRNSAREYLRGIQVDVACRAEDEYRMTLRLGSCVAPGFFSWEVPMGDSIRVGLCVSPAYGTPSQYLRKLLQQNGLDRYRIKAKYSGKIPIGGRRITHGERILLIGDAAGQVKPVSGGGLNPAFKAAPHLRDAVNTAFDLGIFSSTILALYDRDWKRDFGGELDRGSRMRKAYLRLNDDRLNRVGALFDNPEVLGALARIDLDAPSEVIKPILAQKGMKTALLKILMGAYL